MENTAKFTGRHLDYAAARPAYPAALLEKLLGLYTPPEQFTAADIGSGTGKLTSQLLERGFTVYAVEPNGDMRSAAQEALGGSSRFHSVDGTDQATGLADQSVDFITVAQAFHWFDVSAFARECRRVLKPGEQVFLIWNTRADAPLNQALYRVFQTWCPEFHGFSGGITEDDPRIQSFFGGDYIKDKFPNPLFFDREHFLRRSFSSSYSLPESHPDYSAYRRDLENLFDQYAREGILEQPNDTVVYAGQLI